MHANEHLKISIITVVYNGESYLEQTILSVLAQSYGNIEYIIIDGGSTDGTVELIKKYEDKIDYWVSESDKGIYDAMNKGIQRATGHYIGLINADDWYEHDALATVVEAFNTSNADIIYGGMQILEEQQGSFVKHATENLSNLKKGMLINHPTVFAKRALYETYGLFDTNFKIASDWDMMLRWWLNGAKFMSVQKVLANFRMGGISSLCLKKNFKEKHDIRKKYNTYLWLDGYYLIDKLKSVIPANILLRISLLRQRKIGN